MSLFRLKTNNIRTNNLFVNIKYRITFVEQIERIMKTEKILGTTEFKIVQIERGTIIKDQSKKYIVMFKYDPGHWCFALPTNKTMYLQSIASCKQDIYRMQERNEEKGYKCEFQIAEIINPC